MRFNTILPLGSTSPPSKIPINPHSLRQLAEHFFPSILERDGDKVPAQNRRWVNPLPIKSTSTKLWSSDPCWPFHYDAAATNLDTPDFVGQLWIQLPLKDRAVSRKLRACRQLNNAEIRAVQNLYFAPRAMLAPLAMIFSNFDEAVNYLVEEPDECARFEFFRNQFVTFHRRCEIIAEHLACHVERATGCEGGQRDGTDEAWTILRSLIADENFAQQSWEDDTGAVPTTFKWDPHFSGSAFVALLGLIGTGIYGKYEADSGAIWTELRGPVTAFGPDEDVWNTPVLTIIPQLAPGPGISQEELVVFKNGFVLNDAYGEAVNGSQPFEVEWNGLLLVEHAGHFYFHADKSACEDDARSFKNEDRQRWIVTIGRGQKTWTLLNHCWPESESAPDHASLPVCLSRGSYRIAIRYHQNLPEHDEKDNFSSQTDGSDIGEAWRGDDNHSRPWSRGREDWKPEHGDHGHSPSRRNDRGHSDALYDGREGWRAWGYGNEHAEEHGDRDIGGRSHHETGFQLRYKGPDTQDREEDVPFCQLIRKWKTAGLRVEQERELQQIGGPLHQAVNTADQYLDLHYVSTLRDIRRTYQRAFKALLFARRFCLSARLLECDWQSELGFMLDHRDCFEGISYYTPEGSTKFQSHKAWFDFNLLPVSDIYGPHPDPNTDLRANPTPQRQAALFDWWERIFDYTRLRKHIKAACGRELWLLFEEVVTQQPPKIEQLLRHMNVNLSVSQQLLTYFDTPLYQLAPADLLDERWAIRLWHANEWVQAVQRGFFSKNLGAVQPALWASDDLGATVGTTSGNADLINFVQQALLNSEDVPQEFNTLKRLNNGLRERARQALFAYLCGLNRVPLPFLGPEIYATAPRDLSDLLLQDVEVGLLERSSRIEDAIHAAQTFVQRVRLGVETTWTATADFIKLWEHRYSSFETWQAWKRRQVYGEKWLAWDEIQKVENKEGLKFLLSKLPQQTSTVVKLGRPFWWPNAENDPRCDINLIQAQELASFSAQHDSDFEGLSLLGQPLRDGRATLLASVALRSASTSSNPPLVPSDSRTGGNDPPSSGPNFPDDPPPPPNNPEIPRLVRDRPSPATTERASSITNVPQIQINGSPA